MDQSFFHIQAPLLNTDKILFLRLNAFWVSAICFFVPEISLKTSRKRFCSFATISFNLGCGAGTRISDSGSRHLHFWLRHDLVHKLIITALYKSLASPTRVVELEHKFQAPAYQSFDSGSSLPKLVGLRLHSPGFNQCVHKAPFRILWHY